MDTLIDVTCLVILVVILHIGSTTELVSETDTDAAWGYGLIFIGVCLTFAIFLFFMQKKAKKRVRIDEETIRAHHLRTQAHWAKGQGLLHSKAHDLLSKHLNVGLSKNSSSRKSTMLGLVALAQENSGTGGSAATDASSRGGGARVDPKVRETPKSGTSAAFDALSTRINKTDRLQRLSKKQLRETRIAALEAELAQLRTS